MPRSNCCSAPILPESDICSKCKEHCEAVEESVLIQWSLSGNVECPYCNHDNEFTNEDEWYDVVTACETKDFEKPVEMECEQCGKTIQIVGAVY